MTATNTLDVNALLELARDKSKKSRAALITAINDLYSGEESILTETDRVMMSDILRCLIHDVEKPEVPHPQIGVHPQKQAGLNWLGVYCVRVPRVRGCA